MRDRSSSDPAIAQQNQVSERSSIIKSCQSPSDIATPLDQLTGQPSQNESKTLVERKQSSEIITLNSHHVEMVQKEISPLSSASNSSGAAQKLGLQDQRSLPVESAQSLQK